ncbi:MAG TPA: GntR family transcriptional regulator [Terriglobales bacterium]|nr:GntR family transcriptional regulator [Terriglobales bacterium]
MAAQSITDNRILHRVSVGDQVAAVLRQRILNGELHPGTQLQEVPLAASLGVSRNTMREGFRVLASEGLLTRNIHRGVTVAQLSLSDVREIYALRRMLEQSAVKAAKNLHKETLEQLRMLVDRYEAAGSAGDWIEAVGWDLQFHALLVRSLDNGRLEHFYQKILSELRLGMVLVDRSHDHPSRLTRVHRKIYQLIAAGKLKQCAAVLAKHLDDSESRLTQVMTQQAPAKNAKAAVARASARA